MIGRTPAEVAPKLKAIMTDAVAGAANGTGALRGTYRVDVELHDDVTTEARARGFRLIVDEPPSCGGADAGPNRKTSCSPASAPARRSRPPCTPPTSGSRSSAKASA